MKKIFTLTITLVCGFTLFAQYQIPNFSFENWSQNGTYMWPDNWEAYDSISTAQKGLVQRVTNASNGNYGARLNCHLDDGFVTGAWLIMEDKIPFVPEAFTLDYILPTNGSFLSSIRINIYFYDSTGDYIDDLSLNISAKTNSYRKAVLPLSFNGRIPKKYSMDVKFQNINGDLSDYTIVDNAEFLENYNPTGLSEVSTKSLSLYPNPVSQTLYIPSDLIQIEVVNLAGKTVLTREFNAENNIDVSQIPAGIYIIKAIKDNQVLTSKFLKQ